LIHGFIGGDGHSSPLVLYFLVCIHTLPWLPSRDRPVTIVAITIQTATGRWLEIKGLRFSWPVFPAAGASPLQAQPRHGMPAGLKSALDVLPGAKRTNMPGPGLCLTVRSVLVFDLDAFHGLLSNGPRGVSGW
jgi:hypothetical protein